MHGSGCPLPELQHIHTEHSMLGPYTNFTPDRTPDRPLYTADKNEYQVRNLNNETAHYTVQPSNALLKSAATSLLVPRPDPYERTHIVSNPEANIPLLAPTMGVAMPVNRAQAAVPGPNTAHRLFGSSVPETIGANGAFFGPPQLSLLGPTPRLGQDIAAPIPPRAPVVSRPEAASAPIPAPALQYTPPPAPPMMGRAAPHAPSMLPTGIEELSCRGPAFNQGPTGTPSPLALLEAFNLRLEAPTHINAKHNVALPRISPQTAAAGLM